METKGMEINHAKDIMLKKLLFLLLSISISSCSILPGMQNPNINTMRKVYSKPVQVQPTLIPITPELIADEKISKYVYHVAPADVLTISIWQHPEFTIQETQTVLNSTTASTQGAAGLAGYLVNSEGVIYYPLIGNVSVANKTIDEIRLSLTSRLKRYVRNPQVYVRVSDFRGQKIYVFGEVNKSGFLPINDQPLTITDALTLSGSIDPEAADPAHIYVIRGNIRYPNIYWLNAATPEALLLAEHFTLQPGDILYVSSATATRWNRVLNQILPTLQTVWYTKTITNS